LETIINHENKYRPLKLGVILVTTYMYSVWNVLWSNCQRKNLLLVYGCFGIHLKNIYFVNRKLQRTEKKSLFVAIYAISIFMLPHLIGKKAFKYKHIMRTK